MTEKGQQPQKPATGQSAADVKVFVSGVSSLARTKPAPGEKPGGGDKGS